ncbi:MAG: S8 family serine peptidase, partial [Planctomycetota bacterium]
MAADKVESLGGSPNLAITSIQIVNSGGNPISPVAGKEFWVRVNFSYANPLCTYYTIRRAVNGWTHTAPAINWGCGYSGTTSWSHYWGTWVMHKNGTYSVTVILDADNAIAESNESDNAVTINFSVSGDITAEWALVNAEYGRQNLGDGTGVIVGTMDDAFDFHHPWYLGNDSNGNPRLVASNQNSLGPGGSPINADHATSVMGIVLARGLNDGDITGLAPDARYVTAEFINRADEPGLSVLDVLDAAGFLVENNVDVINMCWSWWYGSDDESMNGETSVTNLMADYLAYGLNIVCVPAVNQLDGYDKPTAPGSSRNVITVGGLDDGLQRAWGSQDHGPTLDGRCKPDLLGNDAANAVSASAKWRDGFPAGEGYFGTSFSAPFVTGAVAQMIDYGRQNRENTDHRVIKAIIMNSGVKAKDADGSPWSNSPTQPLDDEQGTGILAISRVHAMYAAGEQPPKAAAVPGYDFGEVTMTVDDWPMVGRVVYRFGQLQTADSGINITLVWDRHTFWNDTNGNGLIDAADSFFTSSNDCQDNLDIVLYRNGIEIATSRSTVDNIEHISLTGLQLGQYELHVERLTVPNSGDSEEYAIAWYSDGLWSTPILGDLDNDSDVDTEDLAVFIGQWLLQKLPADVAPDGGDGIANFLDWADFASGW